MGVCNASIHFQFLHMTKFESKIKAVAASQKVIFNTLSDLHNLNLEDATSQINDDRLKGIRIEGDTIYMKAEMMGEMGLKLIEKEPTKTLKFEGVNAPIELLFWIQIKEVAENDSRIKLTLKAQIPAMLKPMASKPINEFLEKLASAIANKNYN